MREAAVGRLSASLAASRGRAQSSGFFFSCSRRHTRFDCDWSSDVCSSDLTIVQTGSILKYSAARGVLSGLIAHTYKELTALELRTPPTRSFALNGIFSTLKFMGGRMLGDRKSVV